MFFSEFRTNFGCREINFPITDGECEQNTTHTACTDAHSVSARHTAQSDHFSSREHARSSSLRTCVPKAFCHPRVMSRSLPHLTLTASTSSLSPTSPILQSSSFTHPSLLSLGPCIHYDELRRSCGSSDLQSPTGCES